jgi:hypothetical protein
LTALRGSATSGGSNSNPPMQTKSPLKSAFVGPRVVVALLVCAAACLLVTRTLPAFLRSEAPAKLSQRTLTFAERVADQRAIEDVYWRHRIWPKERHDAKPSLDAVMSQAQLEKKVSDYLRKSQALEDYWQRPLTSEQLQAEMDRMAKHTKQPEVLREIFEALGNDPFVIAETLVRSALNERLLANVALEQVKEKSRMFSHIAAGTADYALPMISDLTAGCADDTWTAVSLVNAPTGRASQTAVWTGSEMIVWGGDAGGNNFFNTGSRYNPSTDTWVTTSTLGAPTARAHHTAVWTGSEMIDRKSVV